MGLPTGKEAGSYYVSSYRVPEREGHWGVILPLPLTAVLRTESAADHKGKEIL